MPGPTVIVRMRENEVLADTPARGEFLGSFSKQAASLAIRKGDPLEGRIASARSP
jgi:hypothetical protein